MAPADQATGSAPTSAVPAPLLRSVARAAAILWLPAVLPFFFGPLGACSHCVRTYWMLVPVVPGFLAGMVAHGAAAFVLAGLLTAALWAGLTVALRRLPPPLARGIAILLACATGAQALILGNLLRM